MNNWTRSTALSGFFDVHAAYGPAKNAFEGKGSLLEYEWDAWRDCAATLIERYEAGTCDELEQVTLLVEEFINSGDEELVTIVTTGFLESLIHASDVKSQSTLKIFNAFGLEAKGHISAYNAFYGIPTDFS